MLNSKTTVCLKCGYAPEYHSGAGTCPFVLNGIIYDEKYKKLLTFVEWIAEGKTVSNIVGSHDAYLVRSMALEILAYLDKKA